jgi:ribosomal protein S18 acetylase RimI-like enzyme
MFVRSAVPADAEAIGLVRVSAWRAAYREHMPPDYLAKLDPSANLDGLRSALGSSPPPFNLKVVEAQHVVVAFSMLGAPRQATTDGTLELWALNVVPSHWRAGCGKSLVVRALNDAKESGASRIELWCVKGNNAACALYEAAGFVRTGDERSTTVLTGHPLHELAYAREL